MIKMSPTLAGKPALTTAKGLTMSFDVEKSEYGDLFTFKEFVDAVNCGAFIPDDGCGYLGTETHYSYDYSVWSWDGRLPKDVTHVHWFNK